MAHILFAVPAGVIADLRNRKTIVMCSHMAISISIQYGYCDIVRWHDRYFIVNDDISLNLGLAFNQPVMASFVVHIGAPTEINKQLR